jgi:hypothetical protein
MKNIQTAATEEIRHVPICTLKLFPPTYPKLEEKTLTRFGGARKRNSNKILWWNAWNATNRKPGTKILKKY